MAAVMFLMTSSVWHFFPMESQVCLGSDSWVWCICEKKGRRICPEMGATLSYTCHWNRPYLHVHWIMGTGWFNSTVGRKSVVRTLVLHYHRRCHLQEVSSNFLLLGQSLCLMAKQRVVFNKSACQEGRATGFFSGKHCTFEIWWSSQACFRLRWG